MSELTVYTINEAAAELKFKPNKIRSLIRAGSLKACKIGNAYRIRRVELEKLLELDHAPTEALNRAARVALMENARKSNPSVSSINTLKEA